MEEWQDPNVILVWISLGTIFLLILLVFIIVLTRMIIRNMVRARLKESQMQLENQQKLIEATIIAQEVERERIAADLHDELIGKLNAIKMESEIGTRENFDVASGINRCIQTARRISHDLSPPLIEYSTIKDIVLELVEVYELNYDVQLFIIERDPKLEIRFSRFSF